MRWMSWLSRSRQRRMSVMGLDVGSEFCRLVLLTGTIAEPDTVCCAERLQLPEGLVSQGRVLAADALGMWLRSYLQAREHQPKALYIGIDGAWVSHHVVSLVAGLSVDDVAFQLQAEVQAEVQSSMAASPVQPLGAFAPHVEVCIDFAPDTQPSPAGQQRYVVQAAPIEMVEAWQRVAQVAGISVKVVEPRRDAALRVTQSHALAQLSPASAALALQGDEAFGLALRAWHNEGVNFLPYRDHARRGLRLAWLKGVTVCALGGALLAAGFAVVMASAADTIYPRVADVSASDLAYDQAHKSHAQAQAVQTQHAEQTRWLRARKDLQSQSLQWGRVLSQSAQGVWVTSVKQQGAQWTLQGEALSSSHAQQLVQQLKALDIWAQAPELPQLLVVPAASTAGLPVWQFRIEAILKVGV